MSGSTSASDSVYYYSFIVFLVSLDPIDPILSTSQVLRLQVYTTLLL